MADISAAIVVLTSPITDASRQRLLGFGLIVTGAGLVAWLAAIARLFQRL